MAKYNPEDLIKKIDEKILELEKQENPCELLKKSLLKKKIISSVEDLTDEKVEELFQVIKENLNK
jgi:hypothetical protein